MFLMRSILIFRQSPIRCMASQNFRKKDQERDPGIGRRKKLLKFDKNEEVSDFEDLESDFMDVHHSHREFLQEAQFQKDKEKYYIVKQKYFKEKYPNFLTWHDKEQIRYLHQTNPEEWSIEKLAEGFPAMPSVIKKIVKSHWTKKKQNQITNHDASVQNNWKLFKMGQIPDLPKELVEHLNKFTDRSLNLHPFEPPFQRTVVKVKNEIKSTEFSDIIGNYMKLKTENSPTDVDSLPELNPPEIKLAKSRRPVTLDLLQHDLSRKVDKGQELDSNERNIVMTGNLQGNKNESSDNMLIDLSQNKFPKTHHSLTHYKKEEREVSHLNYPERISIPKKLLKEGSIYKLNDCYYDTDGEFLYRVPGMG